MISFYHMKIYMVRHGESEGNLNLSVQSNTEPLTETGIKQAKTVAKRLKTIDIDVVVSSTAVRAVQTAKEIVNELGVPHIKTELMVERRHPSRFLGKPRSIAEFRKYELLRKENLNNPNWRFEDGENFFDVLDRVKKSKKFIEEMSEKHIVVVSHGIFIRNFFGYIFMGEKYSTEFVSDTLRMRTSNTGITVFDVEKIEGATKWSIRTWNDHSHLPS